MTVSHTSLRRTKPEIIPANPSSSFNKVPHCGQCGTQELGGTPQRRGQSGDVGPSMDVPVRPKVPQYFPVSFGRVPCGGWLPFPHEEASAESDPGAHQLSRLVARGHHPSSLWRAPPVQSCTGHSRAEKRHPGRFEAGKMSSGGRRSPSALIKKRKVRLPGGIRLPRFPE